MTRKLYIVLLAVLLTGYSSMAQELRFEKAYTLKAYQKILENARQTNRMLFLVVNQNNDDFQQKVVDKEFDNPEVVKAFQSYKPLVINVESEMGSRWVQLFEAHNLPSYYYVSSDETVLLQVSTVKTTRELANYANQALSIKLDYQEALKKFASHKLDIKGWLTLLNVHALNSSFQETQDLAYDFFNTLNEQQLLTANALPVLIKYALNLETPYPEKVLKNKAQIKKQLPAFDFNDYYQKTYSFNMDLALFNKDSVLLEKIISDLIPYSPEASSKDKLAFDSRKLFATETKTFTQWRKATMIYAQTLSISDSAKAEFIFDNAFEIADNYNTSEAQKTVKVLANEANKLKNNFRYKMLEGYIAYLLKNYEEANNLVNEARNYSDKVSNQKKADSLLRMIAKEQAEQK